MTLYSIQLEEAVELQHIEQKHCCEFVCSDKLARHLALSAPKMYHALSFGKTC